MPPLDDTQTDVAAPAPAMTIGQVRQKYPQYQDLSDEALAQGLHRKFYSDMPFETFAGKIGLPMGGGAGRRATLPLAQRDEGTAPYSYQAPDNVQASNSDEGVPDSGLRRIVKAGVGGFKQAMDDSSILTPKAQEALDAAQREGGVKGRLAQLGSTAAADVGIGLTAPGALFAGAQKGLDQFGQEIGVPGLGPAAGAFMEAFPQESMGMHGVLNRTHGLTAAERAQLAQETAYARGAPLPAAAPAAAPPPQAPIPTMTIRPEDAALAELEPEEGERPPTSPLVNSAAVTPNPAPIMQTPMQQPPPSPAGRPAPSVEPLPPATFTPPPPSPPPVRSTAQIQRDEGVGHNQAVKIREQEQAAAAAAAAPSPAAPAKPPVFTPVTDNPPELVAQVHAIADGWEQMGNPGMAKAVRAGANLRLTPEMVEFNRQKLEAAQAQANPSAPIPKPAEQFDLGAFQATKGPRAGPTFERFQKVASPDARDLTARVQEAGQSITDQINALGFTRGLAGTGPQDVPAAVQARKLKEQFGSLMGSYDRFVNGHLAEQSGWKTADPQRTARDYQEVSQQLQAIEGRPPPAGEGPAGAPSVSGEVGSEAPIAPAQAPINAPIGVVMPRDPRVMPTRKGDFMVRTLDGWMVGTEAALKKAVGDLADHVEEPKNPPLPEINPPGNPPGNPPADLTENVPGSPKLPEVATPDKTEQPPGEKPNTGEPVGTGGPAPDRTGWTVADHHAAIVQDGIAAGYTPDRAKQIADKLAQRAWEEAQPNPRTGPAPDDFPPGEFLDYPAVIQSWTQQHGPDGAMARVVAQMLRDRDRLPAGTGTDPRLLAKTFQQMADMAYGGKLAEGAYGRDRLYDAIELGVNRYIRENGGKFDPRADAARATKIAEELEQVKDRLPTQTVRAGEKDTHQQFSTPPDFAYAAAWVANIKPGDTVLEPSAGTGSLAVHAMNAGAHVITNEISDKRAAMLKDLGPDRIMREDATQIHNTLPAEVKPSVVVMNPPFSAAPGRMGDKMVLLEGARHINAALASLEPGGRLVAIVGRGMTMEAPAFKAWWANVQKQYDVKANVGVAGKIYRKYGTNFATRLLVIDKVPPTGNPVLRGEVESAANLIERLGPTHDTRPRTEAGTVEPVADQPVSQEVAPGGKGLPGTPDELPGPTGVLGAGAGPDGAKPNEPKPAGAPQPGERNPRPAADRPGGSGNGKPVVPKQPEPVGAGPDTEAGKAPPASDDTQAGSGGGAGDGVRPDGSGERDEPGVTPAPETVVQTEAAVKDPKATGVTEAVYEDYKPARLQIPGAKPHPGALVQSAAMASVDPPPIKHNLALPKELIKNGALSDAQLEAIAYAGAAHEGMLPDESSRRGFFIGDGTGVGKGREVAGIILDNWMKGRKKALWISEKGALANDAKRDWSGLGRNPTDIIEHSKVKAGDAIPHKQGILFTSYDTLKSAEQTGKADKNPPNLIGTRTSVLGQEGTIEGMTKTRDGNRWKIRFDDGQVTEGTSPALDQKAAGAGDKKRGKERVDQIVDWLGKDFDGVIAFDEAHNMGNAIDSKGTRGVKKASMKALAGVELQKKLPNARVVYVSATGATEVSNLAYADRLGLWGKATAFADRNDFMSKIASAGVAGMELVARDMKALGHYISRNLSYDGVEYNRLEHPLNPDQRVTYDKLAEGWQVVLQNFHQALADTGADKNPKAKSAMLSQFWGAHQRFFNQIITSMQMPTVLKEVEKDIKEGRQVVLQLVNTMEAQQERALERARIEGDEGLEDLDMTPRDQLMQMVERAFPVHAFEEYEDDNGNVRSRPAVDSEGKPVVDREMVARREKLLDELGSLRVPDGPLEMLTNHLGEQLAEVTGRKQRIVRKMDENGEMKTVVEKRGASANIVDAKAFQDGKKKALVFSEAGGTGRSYHADIGAPSAGARRVHYLVQPGWRADKAVQGFGRTHRTNQASAPIFRLVTTDLQGQKRFISSIARRLGQLGALTKGERRAGDQGLFGRRDNLESREAKTALTQFFQDLHAGRIEGITEEEIEKGMGLKLRDENGNLRRELPEMSQFLNRMLSLKIDHQNKVFGAFSDRMDAVIDRAAAAGTLDTGVETYQADKIRKKSEQTVYTDERSGAETKHVHLETQNKNNPTNWGQLARTKPDTFVQNKRSGRTFAVHKANDYTDANGNIVPQYRLTSPLDYQFVDQHKITADNWDQIKDPAQAKALWDKQVADTPEYRKGHLHIITGAVLPIWNRLGGDPKIYRLATDEGERMLGRVIPSKAVDATLERLGAGKVAVDAGDAVKRILGGDVAHTADGWRIKPSLVAGERRLELIGPDYRHAEALAKDGVFSERINYQTRYFIPTGDKAAASLGAILKDHPIARFDEDPQAGPGDGGGTNLYSFPAALFDLGAWRKALGLPAMPPPRAMEVLRDKQGISRAIAEVKAGLSPTSLHGAAPMERELRAHTGRSAQAYDQTFHALEEVRLAVDQLSKDAQVDFTDRMETGQQQQTPELQRVADALRHELDGWAAKIQGLGKGYLANAIEDYMGHIWGNYREWAAGTGTPPAQTAMQSKAIAGNVRRQPLRGSGNFLKQRSFPTQLEGIQAGLIPVTYNPVDLQLIKLHEIQKFYHGTVLAERLKDSGIAQWVREPDQRQAEMEGKVRLDDKVFQPKLYGVSPIGPVDPGAYYAPEPMARIFNNYMSTGWSGNSSIYDAMRRTNNALNTMQLGLSGFHASFVMADTAISKVALGLQQVMGGQARGLGNIVQGMAAPLAVVNTVRKGAELRRAWLDPAGATPEMRQVVQAFQDAGGRISMPDFFRTANAGAFFKHIGDLKHPESVLYSAAQMFRDAPTVYQKAVMTPLRIAGRALDTLNEPLMGALVPRAKAGVFADLAQDWIRQHPGASRAEMADAMIRFQDSVDNRLGQLNYDNLFWNKTAKDIAFITTRSVGWNLGTLREIGGSFVDTARALNEVAHLRAPKFTTRMAYTIALPIVTAEIGAVLTYLATGAAPTSLLDYFYPPTGTTAENGQQDRRSIPGYMKDVVAFWHDPRQTALNKMSPMLETLQELAKNQDYYGGSIYDPQRDRGPAQAYGDYLLNQTTPFSLRSWNRLNGEGAPALDQSLAFWGFQSAPKSITQPERGAHFQQREAMRAYIKRGKEPGRFSFLNARMPEAAQSP